MTILDIIILIVAGFLGGFCNAIAGGGTFFIFPALTHLGVTPLIANSTNSLASFSSPVTAVISMWGKIKGELKKLIPESIIAIIGGTLGSILLKISGEKVFENLVPWLIGFATILFAISPFIKNLNKHRIDSQTGLAKFLCIFFVTIYSGYFGAGQGIILMAALTILTHDDLQTVNLKKNYLATLANLSALLMFIFSGMIIWKYGIILMIASIFGGYAGGKFSNIVSPKTLRYIIIIIGFTLTVRYSV